MSICFPHGEADTLFVPAAISLKEETKMSIDIWIEVLGYIGSAMVVISMLMTSVVKLRIINGIGSILSGTYALIVGSFPLALMNVCLIVINIYNLHMLLKSKKE